MSDSKNFKKWFQHVKPYFILLLIPILFTLIFGAAMSPIFVEKIPVALYDMDNSSTSRTVIDQFYDCPTFEISRDYNSIDEIKEGIMEDHIRGAIIIPDGFGKDLRGKKGAEALVLVDATNMVIGNNVESYATTIFTTINAGVQMGMLEAGGMVPYQAEKSLYTLNVADRTLYNPQTAYLYYLYAGLLAVFIQQAFLAVTPTILLKEKSRLKKLINDPSVRRVQSVRMAKVILGYAGISLISMLSCLLIAKVLFAYPLRGSLWLTLLLHMIFLICLVGVSLVIAAIFDDVTHCTQFTMFLTIPTFLSCGYSWPEYMMAPGFATAMKAIWPLYYYGNPLKDMMLKGVGMEVIGHDILGGLIYAIVWIPIGLWLYRHKLRTIRNVETSILESETRNGI